MQKIILILLIMIISGCGAVNDNKRVTEPKSYPEYKEEVKENNNNTSTVNKNCSLVFLSAC